MLIIRVKKRAKVNLLIILSFRVLVSLDWDKNADLNRDRAKLVGAFWF